MTAQLLGSELAAILYESKKKQGDLRTAADRSTQDLKTLPQTSENQIVADLRKKIHFASPFLLACGTNNSRLALSGVTCLQRLIVAKALAPERLQETLGALQDCSKINFDIQLKILQSLPSLLQNYGVHLRGELQAKTIDLCASLQQVKSAPVSSTASATLQQVMSSVFDKVEHEDEKGTDASIVAELDIDGRTVSLRSSAYDAFRVLRDVCLLLEGEKPSFALGATLQHSFALELIEAILTNNGDLFETHVELAHLLRSRIMSIITKILSERSGFGISVRTTRILCIVLREHLDIVRGECELPLGLLNHVLDSDSSTPWRRALCMETFRTLYSAPNLVVEIYALFDEKDDKRNLVQESMALFVRLASEKPALIGVGSQSSFPTGQQAKQLSQEQAVLEANSVAGVISGETSLEELASPGISLKWSTMKTPCLEQLDKAEAPLIPETYVYSLVLTCLNNLSESAAKIVLPVTSSQTPRTPARSRKSSRVGGAAFAPESAEEPAAERRKVANPLELVDHPAHGLVVTVAHMIDSCWPAILATSSTFLNASLDVDHYRGLIRSVQRFTQVAGLLRLATPRDAFLTTLTKSAVPAHFVRSDHQTPSTPTVSSPRSTSGSGEGFIPDTPTTPGGHGRYASHDETLSRAMSQRNLMCLRALINLAIALGSILGESWTIIMESLQRADNILAESGTALAREYRSSTHGGDKTYGDMSSDQASLTAEITAVGSAVTRLFQHTSEYPKEAFFYILQALFDLVGDTHSSPQNRTLHFALAKIGELARINIDRLAVEDEKWGWDLLTTRANDIATRLDGDSTSRLMAADITSSVALGVCLATINETPDIRGPIQVRAIASIETEVLALHRHLRSSESAASGIDMDIHRSAVEAVRSILENCGDSLISGWTSTFAVVQSAFMPVAAIPRPDLLLSDGQIAGALVPVSLRIAKSSFACTQLICSDFLGPLKRTRVVFLIDILSRFCQQTSDMNISLTTLTLFWNLSDLLQAQIRIDSCESEQSNGNGAALMDYRNDDELRNSAEHGSVPATWMILLEQLAVVTMDERGDVRIGAVQTLTRILASSAEHFDVLMWTFAIEKIIFRIFEINIQAFKGSSSQRHDSNAPRPLYATSEAILTSWTSTFLVRRHVILALPGFEELWQTFVGYLSAYLELEDGILQKLVFDHLSQIMISLGDSLGSKSVDSVVALWMRTGPRETADLGAAETDESSVVAYLQALDTVYPLLRPRLDSESVIAMADRVRSCATAARASPYTSDLEIMTTLQSRVLTCYRMLWNDLPRVQDTLARHLASFIELPYRTVHSTERGAMTYVAFAKGATTELGRVLGLVTDIVGLCASGAVTASLQSLVMALGQRYRHLKQGKEPSLWRAAAQVSNDILTYLLRHPETAQLDRAVKDGVCNEVVLLANHLRETELEILPDNDSLLSDETFDLAALTQWRRCFDITLIRERAALAQPPPASVLNNPSLSSAVRMTYITSLFRASLLHEAHFSIPADPLSSITKLRAGRVHDPPFHPRVRICYAALDELFAVASQPPDDASGPEPLSPLADAATPLLVLRCALPLQRYIADQPLRGRMPTPTSQRLELLYVLEQMEGLQDRDLTRLVPLVVRASAVARHDAKVAGALQRVVEVAFAKRSEGQAPG